MASGQQKMMGSAIGRRFFQRFSEPGALKRILRRARPAAVARGLVGDDTGSYEAGRALLGGAYDFAGRSATATPETLWAVSAPSPEWAAAAQSFEWLDDLAAVGGEAARDAARRVVGAWVAAHDAYDDVVWSPPIVARRLRAWILNADLLVDSAAVRDGETTGGAIAASIWAQCEWLFRVAGSSPPSLDQLRVAVALATAALAVEGLGGRRDAAFQSLRAAIDAGIAPDGGWIDRSPASAFEAFALLATLETHCQALDVEPPASLAPAIGSLGRAVRFFRCGDGGLPCFHGASEFGDGRVERLLARRRGLGDAPRSLPESGYEKLVGGRASVIVDVGRNEEGRDLPAAHASALALEVIAGRRRLIVNCGSGAGLEPDKRLIFRSETAQSTVVVNDTPFTQRQSVSGGTALVGPPFARAERKEEPNGMWLIAAHNGYAARYGLTVSRRLFLSADGGDFRGEDTLAVERPEHKAALQRALQRLPRGRRARGLPFAVRFHLHADVVATIVADGEATTLRLPHGEVWVMRQAGGALSLEGSLYAGRQARPETSNQIVIRGGAREDVTQIRWAFRRVGELSQLPRDLEALGVTLTDAEAATTAL